MNGKVTESNGILTEIISSDFKLIFFLIKSLEVYYELKLLTYAGDCILEHENSPT